MSKIQGHLDLLFGIVNLFEIEADLNVRKSDITLFSRSIPMVSTEDHELKPKKETLIKVEMHSVEKITRIRNNQTL